MDTRKLYFDVPTQVAYWDEDHYVGGIAYHDMIICGCCGGLMEIKEVYEFAPEGVKPVIVYEDWEAFDDFIIADNERYFEREEEEEEECV